MNKVRKALIPAAGLGTRFLPATKTVPKEMLTVVDQPILLYVVEEAIKAGIEDIVIVSGRGKHAIEDFFDRSYEVEDLLAKSGNTDMLKRLVNIRNMANIISIRQKEALGLGHAVYSGQPVVGDEPFAVLLGDDIMWTEDNTPTVTAQLSKIYAETNLSTVAVMEVSESDVEKYGIMKGLPIGSDQFKVETLVEKPKAAEAPSRMALTGRYVFTNKIFDDLKNTKPGKSGEIQLTDAMSTLAKRDGMIATCFTGIRYDAGDKFGYIQANIEIALKRPELKTQLSDYIKKLAGRLWFIV